MNRPKLTSRDDAGLRKLAGAMLLQALEDINEGDEDTRAEAWQWFNGETQAGLNFVLCCRILGCRPDLVRHSLLPGHDGAEPVFNPAHLSVETAEVAELVAG